MSYIEQLVLATTLIYLIAGISYNYERHKDAIKARIYDATARLRGIPMVTDASTPVSDALRLGGHAFQSAARHELTNVYAYNNSYHGIWLDGLAQSTEKKAKLYYALQQRKH